MVKLNPEIQRLRGVAIILVMLAHFNILLSKLPFFMKNAWVGVDLFFVISGYVVTISFANSIKRFESQAGNSSKKNYLTIVKAFYVRRVFRILPVVLLALLFHIFLTFIFKDEGIFGSVEKILKEDLMFFLLIFNYWRDNTAFQGNLWSLTVEEHFYLFAPFLLYVIKPTKYKVIINIFFICLFVLIIRPFIEVPSWANAESFLAFATHRKVDAILIGVLLANLELSGVTFFNSDRKSYQAPNHIIFQSLVVLLVFTLLSLPYVISSNSQNGIGFTAYAFVAAILVYLGIQRKGYIFQISYLGELLEKVGQKSFCIYLLHIPFVRLLNYYLDGWGLVQYFSSIWASMLLFVAFILFNLIVATPIFNFYEKPLMIYGRSRSENILLGRHKQAN